MYTGPSCKRKQLRACYAKLFVHLGPSRAISPDTTHPSTVVAKENTVMISSTGHRAKPFIFENDFLG